MFKKVIEYLKSREWYYTITEQSDEEQKVIFGILTHHSTYDCMIRVFKKRRQLSIVINFPQTVPQEKYQQLSQILILLNSRFFSGGFEIDFGDGEMRFRNGLFYGKSETTLEVIEHYLNSSIFCIDESYEILEKAVYGADVRELMGELK